FQAEDGIRDRLDEADFDRGFLRCRRAGPDGERERHWRGACENGDHWRDHGRLPKDHWVLIRYRPSASRSSVTFARSASSSRTISRPSRLPTAPISSSKNFG